MDFQFKNHYTTTEANELLPNVRRWLAELREARQQARDCGGRVNALNTGGGDIGGTSVNGLVTALADLKECLAKFSSRDIQIKDIDRGLIDFPGFVGGREVFLCWEEGEESVEHWHDLESGYAGREPL